MWAVGMCKDEADIIEATVRRMVDQVDHVLIADNGSTDGTRELLTTLSRSLPMTVVDDPEPGYYQSHKMSALASAAGQDGAAWVIPWDADECWYSPFGRIADVLAGEPQVSIARAELFDHVATAVDPPDDDPVARMGWRRREPAPLHKVACRPYARVTIHQGNHGAEYGQTLDGLLVVRHFPYRSAEQFVRKARNGAAAYAATDLPEHMGAHWREYGQLLDAHGPGALEEVFREWYWTAEPQRDDELILDPCPM